MSGSEPQWTGLMSSEEKYIEKMEKGLNGKGSYRRMVQKEMKEVKEQQGRAIGLNQKRCEIKKIKVHKKEGRERSRIHG